MSVSNQNPTPDRVLGHSENGAEITIDFPTLVGKHTLIAAMTGAGKSACMRKVLELALASAIPVIVIDCEGAYASLRDMAPNGILVVGDEAHNTRLSPKEIVGFLPQLVEDREKGKRENAKAGKHAPRVAGAAADLSAAMASQLADPVPSALPAASDA